jgi:hypothetical protein
VQRHIGPKLDTRQAVPEDIPPLVAIPEPDTAHAVPPAINGLAQHYLRESSPDSGE